MKFGYVTFREGRGGWNIHVYNIYSLTIWKNNFCV
jgi:hypothetical protein